jgi:thioredoxin-related protein
MVRRSLLITAIFLFSLCYRGFAQQSGKETIPWMSFEKAIETNAAAKKHKKKIFIDVYTDWCGWCTKMETSTFSDSSVIKAMNSYFLAVKLNAERKDTVRWAGNIYVNPNPSTPRSTHQLAISLLKGQMAYPAFVFMDTEEKVIVIVKGYRTSTEFLQILDYYGKDIYLSKTWAQYLEELSKPKQ